LILYNNFYPRLFNRHKQRSRTSFHAHRDKLTSFEILIFKTNPIMKNEKLFSILIVSLFISLCGGIITFYDKNLMPQQMIPYSDNSIVFRLFERLNITCNVPNLTYKILHPNGTSNLITVYDHQIPFFNFCQDDHSGAM